MGIVMSTHTTTVTARVPIHATEVMIVIEGPMVLGIMRVTAATFGGMDTTSAIATMGGEARTMNARVADLLTIIDGIDERLLTGGVPARAEPRVGSSSPRHRRTERSGRPGVRTLNVLAIEPSVRAS